ncbi:F0F1 ATP synthase subunit A [Roseovarius sp. C7]|uniref:F0F1 ATP synthase subunit A n=1 Tax=Roseovarius sp. C7 TaxID=3398643 RepID=UPI0039F66274
MASESLGMEAGAEKSEGLVFHPMDQFIVKPLFPKSAVAEDIDMATGEATVAYQGADHSVHLSADQLAYAADGKEVYVDLVAQGIQKVGMFTFTNSSFWMVMTVLAATALLVLGSSGRSVIPSRIQSIAELCYGFIRKMVEDVASKDALPYFPYIMTLFVFIIFANFLGLLPGAFTPTSHIAVTAILAMAVFLTVTVLGFVKNGAGFLGLFWVSSAPLALRPILALIEVISYFVRPVSHSIRLAGNMMAGHAVIKVFAAFAPMILLSTGLGLLVTPLSILAITAVYALEVLVAFIQAYVFTILTCVYLKDALHPHH